MLPAGSYASSTPGAITLSPVMMTNEWQAAFMERITRPVADFGRLDERRLP